MKTKKRTQKPLANSEQENKKQKRNKPIKNTKRKLSIYDDFEDLDSDIGGKYDQFQN
ncbi:MAG: hypothetical protein ACEPOZ_11950 [Marinifilaceae bacterium]